MPLDRRLRDDLHRTADIIEPDTEVGLERVTRRRAASRTRTSGAMLAAAMTVIAIVFVAVIMPGRQQDGAVPGGVDPTGRPVPTVRDSTGILGSWSVTLTDADPGVSELGMSGEWTMHLGADATIDLVAPDGFQPPSDRAPTGYVHAEDGSMLLTTLFARDFSESCTGPGTYTWSVTGDGLSLAAVEDTCGARRALLATRPWTPATSGPG